MPNRPARGQSNKWHKWLPGILFAVVMTVCRDPAGPHAPSAQLLLSPAETTVYVGKSLQLRASTLDSSGNANGARVIWSTTSPTLFVSPSGQVTGKSFGHAYVYATVDSLRDSVLVSVVPHGVIAAMSARASTSDPFYIVYFNTDGSEYGKTLIPGGYSYSPLWDPTRNGFIFVFENFARDPRLYRTTETGVRTLMRAGSDTADAFFPSLSRDGQWVYFTRRPGWQDGEIWRVRVDGSAPALVGPATTNSFDLDLQPSASPDGSEVVYSSFRAGERRLRVVTVATGEVHDLNVIEGRAPSWSPRGDQLAFIQYGLDGNQFFVGKPDGSDARLVGVAPPMSDYDAPASWSPDGRWLVVALSSAGERLALVDTDTWDVIPLPWTAGMLFPTWKP